MSRPPYPVYPPHHPHHGRPFITVHEHDILCGRGVNIASHPGNERFRALVQSRHDENYCTNYTTSEKRAIAEQILKHIKSLDPPGRFLKRIGRAPSSRGLNGPWEELSDREAIKKTCQALRDCNRADRTGYAAAVNVPDDVRRHAQSRSASGLSNKEQAAAAAAAKAQTEATSGPHCVPMHPPHHMPHSMGVAMAPAPVVMPYHPPSMPTQAPGMMPMHMPISLGMPMPIRPDLNATTSQPFSPPTPMALPPPQPHMHHHHHLQVSAPHHHLQHHHHHPPQHVQYHLASQPHSGHNNTGRQDHHHHILCHDHSQQEQAPSPAPSPVAHQHNEVDAHSNQNPLKRTYEQDGAISPSVENAAEWLKKQKAVDPITGQLLGRGSNPSPSNGEECTSRYASGNFLSGYDISATRTPSQETTTTTGTTPTTDGTGASRAHRPSLSPASAMPHSPTLAYVAHHPGTSYQVMYSHPHDFISPPTPTAGDHHPFAFHQHHHNHDHPVVSSAPSSELKHGYNGTSPHLDQHQLQAAAEAAAAAVTTADEETEGDYADPSPNHYNHDSLLL